MVTSKTILVKQFTIDLNLFHWVNFFCAYWTFFWHFNLKVCYFWKLGNLFFFECLSKLKCKIKISFPHVLFIFIYAYFIRIHVYAYIPYNLICVYICARIHACVCVYIHIYNLIFLNSKTRLKYLVSEFRS